ncbi:hypothetical protein QJQ45_019205, partial [Haematococcus lacustris]
GLPPVERWSDNSLAQGNCAVTFLKDLEVQCANNNLNPALALPSSCSSPSDRRRPGSPHSYSGLVTPVAPVALVAPPLPVPTLQLPRLRRLLPRLPRKPEQEELKRQIQDYLAKGMIEPSSSPYAAPILFVQKKSGELRMCIDYRQLNKLTLRDQYPLPRIDDLFDRLSGCSVFSSLDLQAGYHQIRITPEDVPKTAFRTPEGHFQFKVLSFGLTNAPATFQRVRNDAFAPVLGKCALVYLDDILVMSKSLPEHLQHLRLVFDLLRTNKLYAKMSKCEFMQLTLRFLGHVISAGAISVDPDKVRAIVDWPVPSSLTQLQSFLGAANFVRKYVHNFSAISAPLTDLCGKLSATFPWHSWPDHERHAFYELKAAVANVPMLRLPDHTQPFQVYCDASLQGVGAVLMQDGYPLAYLSKKLSSAEVNYTTAPAFADVEKITGLQPAQALDLLRSVLTSLNSIVSAQPPAAPVPPATAAGVGSLSYAGALTAAPILPEVGTSAAAAAADEIQRLRQQLVGVTAHLEAAQNEAVRVRAELSEMESLQDRQNVVVSGEQGVAAIRSQSDRPVVNRNSGTSAALPASGTAPALSGTIAPVAPLSGRQTPLSQVAPPANATLAAPVPMSRVKIPGPDKWTDQCLATSRVAEIFCEDLEVHCAYLRIDPADALPNFLTGKAREVWYPATRNAHILAHGSRPTWAHLRASFKEMAGDDLRNESDVHRRKLLDPNALRMSAGSTLNAYITDFRNTLTVAGSTCMAPAMLVATFIRGLTSELQSSVVHDLALMRDPTLNDAIQAAVNAQKVLFAVATNHVGRRPPAPHVAAFVPPKQMNRLRTPPGLAGGPPPAPRGPYWDVSSSSSSGGHRGSRHSSQGGGRHAAQAPPATAPVCPAPAAGGSTLPNPGYACHHCWNPNHFRDYCNLKHLPADEARRPGCKPPALPSYKMSQPELLEMKKQVAAFLEQGIIEPSSSPYAAPVLFVKKKSRKRLLEGEEATVQQQQPVAQQPQQELQPQLVLEQPLPPPPVPLHPLHAVNMTEQLLAAYAADEAFASMVDQYDQDQHGLYRTRGRNQIVVPNCPELKTRILVEMHDAQFAGHVGITKTLERISRMFWWPRMRSESDWPFFLSLAEFAVNNSWQESIQSTPFLVNTGQSPLTPALLELPGEVYCPTARRLSEWWQSNVKQARHFMELAQRRQAYMANKGRKEVEYHTGQLVLLSTKNLRMKPGKAKKLLPRFIGPFKVLEHVGPVAVRLDLPQAMARMHPVFHVSLLRPYTSEHPHLPPPVEWLDEAPLYEVEKLLAHRGVRAAWYPARYRWESVSMDFITKLPAGSHGYDAICVFVDRLSKMVHFVPCREDLKARRFAQLFIDHVYKLHGMPAELISDRGSLFTSVFWREIMRRCGSKPALSSSYHPQSDGQTERYNRVLEEMLRHYISSTQSDWPDYLALAEFAVNNSWQESIQSTPFLVNTGQSPVTVGLRDLPYGGRCPSAHAFTRWWQDAVANARKCMAAAQSRQAAYANKARRDVEYKVGQKVLLSTKNLKLQPGKARKLIPRYVGPFEILLLVGAVAVKLDLPASMSRLHPVFHVSLIKPYTGTDVGFMPPPVTWMDETPVYYVERLLDHKGVKDNKASYYLVQWEGYDSTHNTWEPRANLTDCDKVLAEYNAIHHLK